MYQVTSSLFVDMVLPVDIEHEVATLLGVIQCIKLPLFSICRYGIAC